MQVSSDYIGGVALPPGGARVAAACADGMLRLLDWRRAGAVLAAAPGGSPLRCCVSDGRLMLCGTESGTVLGADLSVLAGTQPPVGRSSLAVGTDGLFAALPLPRTSAVNGIAVSLQGAAPPFVATALEDGNMVLLQGA